MTQRRSQAEGGKAASGATAGGGKKPANAANHHSLNPKQQRFIDEYLIDLNATQAAIRAGYSQKTAGQQGERLLKNVEIQAALSERMNDRQKRTEITQDMVLQRWWQIATANPNELISYRRVCCRHCFGEGHEYQWKDREEYEQAIKAAIKAAEEATMETGIEVKPRLPTDDGGYGFDPTIKPHPKCPKCNGEGHGEVFAQDTRELSPEAQALYAGVKITKDGLEIKMQDQGKALENVARHLGMFNDKVTLKGDEENPLQVLFGQLAGKTLKPGMAVEDDEE